MVPKHEQLRRLKSMVARVDLPPSALLRPDLPPGARRPNGTAFVIAPDVAVTALHVLDSNDDVHLVFTEAGETRRATRIRPHPDGHDLALLHLDRPYVADRLPWTTEGVTSALWTSFGYPTGVPGGHVVTDGTIPDHEKLIPQRETRVMHLETRLAKESLAGMSGAPCVVDGYVVGIITDQLERLREPSLDTLYGLPAALIARWPELAAGDRTALPVAAGQLLALFEDDAHERRWIEPTITGLDTGAQMPASDFAAAVRRSQRRAFGVEASSGAGKSTLLNYLGCQAAREVAAGRSMLMPVRLDARALAEAPAHTDPYHFAVLQGAHERNCRCDGLCSGFFSTWPVRSATLRFLVLLEGLDELSLKQRRTVGPFLDALLSHTGRGGGVIMVTRSRHCLPPTIANELAWYTILPFSAAQQQRAIERWCTGPQRTQAPAVLNALPEAIRQHPQWLQIALEIAGSSTKSDESMPSHVTALYRRYEEEALPAYARDDPDDSFFRTALQTYALWSVQTHQNSVQLFKRERLGVLAERLGEPPGRAQDRFGRLIDDLLARRSLLEKHGGRVVWKHSSFQEYFAACALVSSNEEVRKAQPHNDGDPVDVLLRDVTYGARELGLFAASMLCDWDREQLLARTASSSEARKLAAASAVYGFDLGEHGSGIAKLLVADLLSRRQGEEACRLLWELYDGAMPAELRCAVGIGSAAIDQLTAAFSALGDVYFLARVFSSALGHLRAFDTLVRVASDRAIHSVARVQALRALFAGEAREHVEGMLTDRSFNGPTRAIAEAACRALWPSLAARLAVKEVIAASGTIERFRARRRVAAGEVFWFAVAAAEEGRVAEVVELAIRGELSRVGRRELVSVVERYEVLDDPSLGDLERVDARAAHELRQARERQYTRVDPIDTSSCLDDDVNRRESELNDACLTLHACAERRQIGRLRYVVEHAPQPELRLHAVKALANIGAARTLALLSGVSGCSTEEYLQSRSDIWFGRVMGMSRSGRPW